MRDNANDAVRRFKSREVLDYISRVRTSMISQIIKSRELSSSPLQAIIADITSRRRNKECSSVVSVLRSRHAKKGYCIVGTSDNSYKIYVQNISRTLHSNLIRIVNPYDSSILWFTRLRFKIQPRVRSKRVKKKIKNDELRLKWSTAMSK